MTLSRIPTALLALAMGTLSAGAGAAYDSSRATVIVAVIDSLMPHEIDEYGNTPTLTELKTKGTWYTESRSVFSAETIPNHVAMMTGRYPIHNGIPTNKYWNRQFENDAPTKARDLSLPSELDAPPIFRHIAEQCPMLPTAAVMSKDYLYEVFSNCGYDNVDCPDGTPDSRPKNAHQPTFHFVPTDDPTFIPEAGLVPDRTTMQNALAILPDVNFMFINMGQVDRMGHVDETGAAVGSNALGRKTVLADTDLLFGELVAALKSAGRWEDTVLIILSDHGMDWSRPEKVIGLNSQFNPHNPGTVLLDSAHLLEVLNGGTDSIYLLDENNPASWERAVEQHQQFLAVTGVEGGWFTRKPPPKVRGQISPKAKKYINEHLLPESYQSGHENLGDIVLSASAGYRFAKPASSSFSDNNFIPGNHGHKPTLHNTMLVTGGSESLKAQIIKAAEELDHDVRAEDQSENVDVAPTVAWLFGIKREEVIFGTDQQGNQVVKKREPYFDGRPLSEAFTTAEPPLGSCGTINR